MPRRRVIRSDKDLVTYREQSRLRHREASFMSRHRTELAQCEQLYTMYQKKLYETEDAQLKIVIEVELHDLLIQIAAHTKALQTGLRIRPVVEKYKTSAENIRYLQEAESWANRKRALDTAIQQQQFDQRYGSDKDETPEFEELLNELSLIPDKDQLP